MSDDHDLAMSRRYASSAGRCASRAHLETEELEHALTSGSLTVALVALGRAVVVVEMLSEDLGGIEAHLGAREEGR